MSSLLERMNISASTGPTRSKSNSVRGASAPYNRANRVPSKGDVEGQWSHDLYETHNSLSARLSSQPSAPKSSLNTIAQKAIRDATGSGSLSIKGASSQGNVVEVTGLVSGTTVDDVALIFKRCGVVTDGKLLSSNGGGVRVRLTFKTPQAANNAVQKFHNQQADGNVLSVKIVGSSATTLGGRLGGVDGLSLVREEGSVDVLMKADADTGSKMRSDSLVSDPRSQVLVAPPGADPSEYGTSSSNNNYRGGNRRGGRGRGGRGRGGRRGGNGGSRMDLD